MGVYMFPYYISLRLFKGLQIEPVSPHYILNTLHAGRIVDIIHYLYLATKTSHIVV